MREEARKNHVPTSSHSYWHVVFPRFLAHRLLSTMALTSAPPASDAGTPQSPPTIPESSLGAIATYTHPPRPVCGELRRSVRDAIGKRSAHTQEERPLRLLRR